MFSSQRNESFFAEQKRLIPVVGQNSEMLQRETGVRAPESRWQQSSGPTQELLFPPARGPRQPVLGGDRLAVTQVCWKYPRTSLPVLFHYLISIYFITPLQITFIYLKIIFHFIDVLCLAILLMHAHCKKLEINRISHRIKSPISKPTKR